LAIFNCQLPIDLTSTIGNWKSAIGNVLGGRGSTKTTNLFLVREAVYH